MIGQCHVCSQIKGDRGNDLLSVLLGDEQYVRRVFLEKDGFAAIPSIGPLVPGHLLLCPLDHFRSFAAIPTTLDASMATAKRRVLAVLDKVYGFPVHRFEHGNALHGDRVTCSVEHAHLHLVPSAVDIWTHLHSQFDWRPIEPNISCLRAAVVGKEYLYYEAPWGEAFVASVDKGGFESQMLRRCFAAALGNESNWNWRENPRLSLVSETWETIVALESAGDTLPRREVGTA